jgi:hypothetical protein
MFDKILIANRTDDGREAPGAAQPHGMARAARTVDFTAETRHV